MCERLTQLRVISQSITYSQNFVYIFILRDI